MSMPLTVATSILAQSDDGLIASLFGGAFAIVWLAIAILVIAGFWKVFTKAGRPGWLSVIPIVNIYVWIQIVGRPTWWIILLLIPFVNVIFGIILSIDLANAFGRGGGFAVGIILLPYVFVPILGFSDAQYVGPVAQRTPGQPAGV